MGLIYSAFPELLMQWRTIPGHPSYLFNKQGEVLSTKLYERVVPYREATEDTPPVIRLRHNGRKIYWSIKNLSPDLVEELFEQKEAA